jgi:hypothetical protein
VSCSMEDQRRRRGNSSPPAAPPRTDGEQGRARRSSFYRRRGRTRSRGRAGRSPCERSSLFSDFSRTPAISRPFSRARVFLPQPSRYGARLPRSATNRTPNRRLPDAMAVRRTPYQSEASRLANRPACSALPIRRRQSDALKTLIQTKEGPQNMKL